MRPSTQHWIESELEPAVLSRYDTCTCTCIYTPLKYMCTHVHVHVPHLLNTVEFTVCVCT